MLEESEPPKTPEVSEASKEPAAIDDDEAPRKDTPTDLVKGYYGKEYRLTKQDKLFILENCHKMTDDEIATKLGKSLKSVRVHRQKRLKISKGAPPVKHAVAKLAKALRQNKNVEREVVRASLDMSEEDRREFLETQLANSAYWRTLVNQLTKDEQDFYMEEWGGLCLQFEDVVGTEKRQIDELIKAQIFQNRIGRSIKITEEEIEKLSDRIVEFRKNHDVQKDENAQLIDKALMAMIRQMSGQSQIMSKDWQSFATLKNKILEELNARRKDRIDQLSSSKTTFLGLVEALRDKQVRAVQGNHAELLRIARETKKDNWRKPQVFPDGSSDPILIDDQTVIQIKDGKHAKVSTATNETTIDRTDVLGGSTEGNDETDEHQPPVH